MPHHNCTDKKLKKGDPILIDIGVVLDDYMSDMTRTFVFEGELPEFEQVIALVREAKKSAFALCKPGVRVASIDEAVRQFFKTHGLEDAFKHSLGHGLGLEIHESPIISKKNTKDVLEEGMVITIEPGLYFEGKWGCRDEDTLLITKDGYENFYPEES